VFAPEKRSGTNGVMFTEYLGIGDFRELFKGLFKGLQKPIVMYPMATPKQNPLLVFELLSVC